MRPLFDQIFARKDEAADKSKVKLVTIWFGESELSPLSSQSCHNTICYGPSITLHSLSPRAAALRVAYRRCQ